MWTRRRPAAAPAAVAPWVRTRLRTAPGAAVALAVLVAVTSFLAAVFPRAVFAYESEGLRQDIRTASPTNTVLGLTAPTPGGNFSQATRERMLRPQELGTLHEELTRVLPEPLRADPAQSAHGVRSSEALPSEETWLPRPYGLPPQFTLAAQADLGRHSVLREGRLPAARNPTTAGTAEVEAAVTAQTARTLRIKVGSVIHVPGSTRGPLAVRISGIVTPLQPQKAYWAVEKVLGTPSLTPVPTGGSLYYWRAGLLLAPEAAPALLALRGGPEMYWRLAPEAAGLTTDDLPELRKTVASVESGPGLLTLRAIAGDAVHLSVATDLDPLLESFSDRRSAVATVVTVAAFGIGALAAVVLMMSGGLIAARRRPELTLLRSRGGSLRGIAGRLFAETAVVAWPAAAAGLLSALVVVGQAPLLPAVSGAVAVAALACAALPVRAAVLHRRPGTAGVRDDLTGGTPSRLRAVPELTVLVLAVGAVAALRRRGTGGPADAGQLISSAPVLVALIAALVLVRIYPLPLRLAARPAGRRRGAVGFLSLSRAGRSSRTGALPLLALLIALTTAAFGGSVLAGVAHARDRAAMLATGADARVAAADDSTVLPAGLTGAVRGSAGVTDATPVRLERQIALYRKGKETQDVKGVTLVGVDPEAYAGLARRTGLGPFPASALRAHGDTTDDSGQEPPRILPAMASPEVAELFGSGPRVIRTGTGDYTVRIAAVLRRTPAVPDAGFLLLDAAGMARSAPTALLVTGSALDTGTLRTAVRKAGKGFIVTSRAEERGRLVDSPLQSGAERIYTTATAAGAGYAVLALLLSLLQTAPERVTLLARLRTMGMTRRQGRRLLVLESLPLALLAAVGGALVGWATIALLAPGVDLTGLAPTALPGTTVSGGATLRADAWSLVVPGAAMLALATGVALVQAWWTDRQGSINELRAGDSR
jgi:putative ABC transport system permease protein